MSLFDKLNNGETKLKSLKYGQDREGGGSSNQPYIKTPLDAKLQLPSSLDFILRSGLIGTPLKTSLDIKLPSALDFLNNDFILRGGPVGAPLAAATDVARLSKYFTDLKSPSGLLFIAKQNLLSRIAVQTQSSGKLVNAGVYTPLSTLGQAAVGFAGIHLNKQGLNPIPGSVGSLRTYTDVVTNPGTTSSTGAPLSNLLNQVSNFLNSFNPTGGANGSNKRLEFLFDQHIDKTNVSNDVLSYSGGPGAFLGIGRTHIRFADQRTGLNNSIIGNNPRVNKNKISQFTYPDKTLSNIVKTTRITSPYSKNTVSGKYIQYFSLNDNSSDALKLSSNDLYNELPIDNSKNPLAVPLNDLESSYNLTLDPSPKNSYTYTQDDLIAAGTSLYRIDTNNLVDFREKLRAPFKDDVLNPIFNILGNAPTYKENRIENRVGAGDPGNKFSKDLTSYTEGYFGGGGYGAASPESYDKINVLSIYKSTGPKLEKPINDLVKFRIAAIDNDDPTKKIYMHFRAFLGSISDSYTGEWNPQRYVGRGENFYTYAGFDRKISLSFTVAAQSKIELTPMYRKLNYLASQLAPDYSKAGYMRGPLITLTIGGYLYEQPGFITSLTYEMSEETPWEIGIDDNGLSDSSVKELPHMIKVTGFNFTPIHEFAPKKQINVYDRIGDLTNFGDQRYIALSNGGTNNNYDDYTSSSKA